MKKNKINIVALFFLFASSLLTTSCNEDDATGDSVIEVNNGNATVSAVSPFIATTGTNNVNEGGLDTTIEYAITLAKAQPVDTYVDVVLNAGGTATEDEDFSFDHEVVIPAWSTSAIGTVTIIGDAIDESDETFSITFNDESDAQINVQSTTLSFNITDFGDLNLVFDWNQPIPGYPFTLCDIGYDVDIFVFDADGAEVSGYQAATGACPEEMTLSLADLADGEYTIMQNVYDDAGLAGAGVIPAFAIPVTVNYSRDNSNFTGSFVQDAADAIDSDFGNVAGYDTQFMYIATLTVENGIFTFSKNGSTVASGRMASSKMAGKKFTKPNKAKRVRVI
jgi:hypothetical protein